ncbi:MAG: hypothetical protein OEV97_09250 [Betaproteobacteria bacterium]|nr:hypothetical protein [Betaproteobacteria bacterium]
MADNDSQLAAIDAKLAAAGLSLKRSQEVEDQNRRLQADDRSHIAKLIVRVFVVLISLLVLSVIAGVGYLGDWDKISEPAKFLSSVLSSVMLPVVTLVIGYYFGKDK